MQPQLLLSFHILVGRFSQHRKLVVFSESQELVYRQTEAPSAQAVAELVQPESETCTTLTHTANVDPPASTSYPLTSAMLNTLWDWENPPSLGGLLRECGIPEDET